MALNTSHTPVVVVGIILSGAFIGNNNTLVTELVMGAAPVERPVASAAYSFVRFGGGAIGPWIALKLFGSGPVFHPSRPFWFGAAALAVGVIIVVLSKRTIEQAHAGHAAPATHSGEEAEDILVGDID
jgi:MFS family permease